MTIPRFRRLASAAALVASPALLLAALAVLPWIGDADAEETLAITAREATATNVGDLLMFVGLLAGIPATLAVMRLLGGRAPALGLVGGSLAIAGMVASMLIVVTNEVNVAVSGAAGIRAEIAAAFDDGAAWTLWVVLAVLLAGSVAGGVVLGVGLLRARVVPAWAAWAIVAAPVVGVVGAGAAGKVVAVTAVAMELAGFAAVARVVAATSDDAWQRGETPDVAAVAAPVATS